MLAVLLSASLAAQTPALRPGLEPLAFLVGHCWRADFPKSGEQDTQCFEPVYDGQHVRSRHEVSGGKEVYRGETLFSADGKGVSFTYWNSLGGVSHGTMKAGTDRIDFGDESYTGADGRKLSFSSHWRRVGSDVYEAVTVSPDDASLNRTLRYRRVEGPVTLP